MFSGFVGMAGPDEGYGVIVSYFRAFQAGSQGALEMRSCLGVTSGLLQGATEVILGLGSFWRRARKGAIIRQRFFQMRNGLGALTRIDEDDPEIIFRLGKFWPQGERA